MALEDLEKMTGAELLAMDLDDRPGEAARATSGRASDGITEKEPEKAPETIAKNPRFDSLPVKSVDTTTGPENVERVTGDVLPPDYGRGVLPDSVIDTIHGIIQAAMDRNEYTKPKQFTPSQWGAVCMNVGDYIKRNRLNVDEKRLKEQGGAIYYNDNIIRQLIDIYINLTKESDQPIIALDGAYFAGVDDTYFSRKPTEKERGLSPLRLELGQKLKKAQEGDLSARLGGGKQNPTGGIFILKNLHGWRDERTVEHVAGDRPPVAVALPDLGGIS